MKRKALITLLPIVALTSLVATGFGIFTLNKSEQIDDLSDVVSLQSIFINNEISLDVNSQYSDLSKMSLSNTIEDKRIIDSDGYVTNSNYGKDVTNTSSLPKENRFGFNFNYNLTGYTDDLGENSEISWVAIDADTTGEYAFNNLPVKNNDVFAITNLYVNLEFKVYQGFVDSFDFWIEDLNLGPKSDNSATSYLVGGGKTNDPSWSTTADSDGMKSFSIELPLNFGLYNDYDKTKTKTDAVTNNDHSILKDGSDGFLDKISTRKKNMVDIYNQAEPEFMLLDSSSDAQGVNDTSKIVGFLGGFCLARKPDIKPGVDPTTGKDNFDEFVKSLHGQSADGNDKKITCEIKNINLAYKHLSRSNAMFDTKASWGGFMQIATDGIYEVYPGAATPDRK